MKKEESKHSCKI